MSFILTALVLSLFSQVAYASPLAADATSLEGKLPVSDIVLVPANVNITFDAFHDSRIRQRQTVHSQLLSCASANCVNCSPISLPTMFETCLGMVAAQSVAVTQQFNEALPYGVFVGPPTCQSFSQIPQINTCFNVVGGPFTDFFLTGYVPVWCKKTKARTS